MEVAHAFAGHTTPVSYRVIGALVDGENVVQAFDTLGTELIELVGPQKTVGHALETGEVTIDDFQLGGLNGGVNMKGATYHFGVPLPLVFGVRGAVNADKTFARLDKAFHGTLLFFVENIAGGIEENYGVILFEMIVVKQVGVFIPVKLEMMFLGQLTHGDDAFVNRFVMPAVGFTEQQYIKLCGQRRHAGDQ